MKYKFGLHGKECERLIDAWVHSAGPILYCDAGEFNAGELLSGSADAFNAILTEMIAAATGWELKVEEKV